MDPGGPHPGRAVGFWKSRPLCQGCEKFNAELFAPRKGKSVVFPFLRDQGLTMRVLDPGAPSGRIDDFLKILQPGKI